MSFLRANSRSLLPDVLAGHDAHDSTTVSDVFKKFTLPEEISIKGLHIGIPDVSSLSF
jgi:hypothetical protein